MSSPQDLRFTKTHEWVRPSDDVATVGLTDFAQTELGDITYLELPEIGATISQTEPFGVVESVKAASDIYAPVDGEVIERNDEAINSPELVNQSPYERAWLIKIRLARPSQVQELMSPSEYDEYAASASSH
jgi:glycine cleavage system H protein